MLTLCFAVVCSEVLRYGVLVNQRLSGFASVGMYFGSIAIPDKDQSLRSFHLLDRDGSEVQFLGLKLTLTLTCCEVFRRVTAAKGAIVLGWFRRRAELRSWAS